MFALVDCNNFYASCERVFNPRLRNRPVIVLSNIYINNAVLLSQELAAMTFGQTPTPPILADDPVAPAEIARLVGDYRFGDGFPDRRKKITVVEENGRLWLRLEGQRAPPSPLLPAGPLAYVDRYNWTHIGFEAQPGAKAATLIYSDGSSSYRAERIP